MKKEIWSCDKCKKTVDKEQDLNSVDIEWGHCRRKSYQYSDKIRMDLCDQCCVKIGMMRQEIKDGDKIVNKPIELKEKLFDVMADLVHEIHEEVNHPC